MKRRADRRRQSGNVFFALFGAVALVGAVGASTMSIMKGPVRSMHNVTQRTIAENAMIAAGKLTIMAASQPGGDCDGDNVVEPPGFVPGGTAPHPQGGGLLPSSVGAAKQDPWGNEFGYCVWDHGDAVKAGACADDAARLSGRQDGVGIVVAVISSGPDRIFQTSCNDEGAGDYVDKPSGSDDVTMTYTYDEAVATAGGAGLWTPIGADAAEIQRSLAVKADDGSSPVFAVDNSADGPSIKVDFIQQLSAGAVEFLSGIKGTDIDISGDLGVTGAAMLGIADVAGDLSVTGSGTMASAEIAGNLGVEGQTNLAALTAGVTSLGATSVTTFGSTGAATLNSLAVTNGATIGTDLSVGDNTLVVDDASGKIGIGTATPLTQLHLVGGGIRIDRPGGGNHLQIAWNASGFPRIAPNGGSLGIHGLTLNWERLPPGGTGSDPSMLLIPSEPGRHLDLRSPASKDIYLTPGRNTILYSGSLGVGTASPSAMLDVAGSAEINGPLDMTGFNIVNLGAPINANDAVNKGYVDAQVAAGTGFEEQDPTITEIEDGKWCVGDADGITCTAEPPIGDGDTLAGLECADGEIPKQVGGAWSCASDRNDGTDQSCIDDELEWTERTPAETNSWQHLIYGDGLFVAVVNNTGTGINRVMTSPDGIIWTARSAPALNWIDIAYGNGLFVAVAYGDNQIMTSTDGITWTVQTPSVSGLWRSVVYGDGIFVAADVNGKIMTSPDGMTWTERTGAEANSWDSLAYGNGLFVAVAMNGTNRVMTSPDGVTWTARAASENNYWHSVTYGNGLFVAAASGLDDNLIMTSPDGMTWTSVPVSPAIGGWQTLTYGGGMFVAIAYGEFATSTDGTTWTSGDLENRNWKDLAFGAGTFVALGDNSTVMTMPAPSCSGGGLEALTCSDDEILKFNEANSAWECAPDGGDAFSDLECSSGEIAKWDGSSWTCAPDRNDGTEQSCSAPLGAELGSIDTPGTPRGVWGDGTYVYVADYLSGVRAYTFDGATFSEAGSFNTPGQATGVWGDGTNIYVADGTKGLRIYSFDGATFTEVASFDTPGQAVSVWGDGTYIYVADRNSGLRAYSFGAFLIEEGAFYTPGTAQSVWGDGTYIYVADYSSGVRAYSFDGANFTERGSIATSGNASGVWGDGSYIYAADYEFGLRAYTFDGTNFAERGSVDTAGDANGVWGDGTHVYVAGGMVDGLRAYSFDGSTFHEEGRRGRASSVWGDGTYLFATGASSLLSYSTGTCAGGGLEARTCAAGEILKFNGTTDTWECSSDDAGEADTLTGLTCAAGEIAKWDGSAWICAPDKNDGSEQSCTGGDDWTAHAAAATYGWRSVTYGDGLFVAVAGGGTNPVMTSPDGITWTQRAAPSNIWLSVTYGNGLFVAVAYSGTDRVITSPDGVTWTARSAPESNKWNDITYGNGLFVAVAEDGTNRIMTSPDGITWTARAAPEANGWRSVTYGNGLFVAVASSGTNRIMTSLDGIIWTGRSAPENNSWYGAAYGDGMFAAVALSGTNRIMTSPDGITWTARAAPEANGWRSVAYGNALFVAVASSGGTNRVMTSPDGVNWSAQAASESNSWASVTYGDGIFAAVALSGTNLVMTWAPPVCSGGGLEALTCGDGEILKFNETAETWECAADSGGDNLGSHIATTTLRSDTNNTDDLGTSSIRWRDAYLSGTLNSNGIITKSTAATGYNESILAINGNDPSSYPASNSGGTFINTQTSGSRNSGVYAETITGIGIVGYQDNGDYNPSVPSAAGGYFVSDQPTGATYGVYGISTSASGRGVYGIASSTSGMNYGVYGKSSSSSGYGVYGQADSPTGYGVYSAGRMHSTGTLTAANTIINDLPGTTYDVWIQGGTASSGDARNLAILGQSDLDALYINYFSEYAGGTYIGGPVSIIGSGTLNVAGSVTAAAYYQSSDRNLKTDIETIADPFALLDRIEGKHFLWKKDGKAAYGVIAQDVEAVMPEAIGENGEGYKTVEYSQLIGPLIEAVKQLKSEIQELRTDNDNLQAANDNLREEVHALKAGGD